MNPSNGTAAMIDPFSRHRQPKDRAETVAPIAAAVQPVDSKPIEEKPSAAAHPFTHHEYEFRPKPYSRGGGRKPPAQELLHWIQRWGKPVVSLRDVRAFGPRAIRDRQVALSQIEILVQRGWLVPLKSCRHDRLVWRLPPPGATIVGHEP
jgi:hypothetical protein